jgi:hypothetical protein
MEVHAEHVASTSGGLTFQLQPRVLFRIAEQYTRVKVTSSVQSAVADRCEDDDRNCDGQDEMEIDPGEGSGVPAQECHTAVGCLLGEQQGRTVEVSNSFDMPSLEFDWGLFQRKIDLYKEMYPSIEVVGWYATLPRDAELGEEHKRLQASFVEDWNAASVVMTFDPRCLDGSNKDDGILRLFESEERKLGGLEFVRATHEILSSDVERIVVSQFSNLAANTDDAVTNKTSETLKNHQESLKSGVLALIERVTLLQQVLIGIREKRLEYDEGVVMAISAFVDRLPLSKDGVSMARRDVSSEAVVEGQKDSLLTILLASTSAALAALEKHSSFDARRVHELSGKSLYRGKS